MNHYPVNNVGLLSSGHSNPLLPANSIVHKQSDTMSISIILIPSDQSKPLESHHISWDTKRNVNSGPFSSKVHHRIFSLLHQDNNDDSDSDSDEEQELEAIDDRVEVPLLRPLGDSPGLYVYFRSTQRSHPNIRGTRLAMACGLMSMRFHGDLVVTRANPSGTPRWHTLTIPDVEGACEGSPDLRPNIQSEIANTREGNQSVPMIPLWMKNVAQQNYHDAAALAEMAKVMTSKEVSEDDSEHDSSDLDDSGGESDNDGDEIPLPATCSPVNDAFTLTAKSPLCLHCRRPTNYLCQGCLGAYFCPPPRDCITKGWSHSCQCQTWKSYVSRREILSKFDYLDPEWQVPLVGREFQLSEEPYKKFLTSRLMIQQPNENSEDVSESFSSWWRTETDGWAGGESASAKQVDIERRRSYEEGFVPIPTDQLPPSRRVTENDCDRAGISTKNGVGLWRLSSWEDYYKLRNIPPESPVALLCTFPLTLYHAIVEYGEVPVTVARMLKRPLRIHVVGTEKELNFLDLFSELGYLLPEDLQVELVFVAREDMIPKNCRNTKANESGDNSQFLLRVEMTPNLTVGVVGGTYGQTSTRDVSSTSATCLDPNFDVGSGPPDMVVALNAGLYAYESWRSVVNYLYHHKGVVGVFTDYNEYSGVHCAGLGGAASRESLCLNPFRQPLAMPVYSMNLPQFSNGFFYVFNPQEMD